jgi:hypothetical protein
MFIPGHRKTRPDRSGPSFWAIAIVERRQFRYITSATMPATIAPITIRQPSLVMQLMIVNGSRISFNAKLNGQVTNLNSANTI